jgi:hypothetical protein
MNDNKNETALYQPDNSIGEIVLYQPDNSIQLEVRVENETVANTNTNGGIISNKRPQHKHALEKYLRRR